MFTSYRLTTILAHLVERFSILLLLSATWERIISLEAVAHNASDSPWQAKPLGGWGYNFERAISLEKGNSSGWLVIYIDYTL